MAYKNKGTPKKFGPGESKLAQLEQIIETKPKKAHIEWDEYLRLKRGRIIIRNLPFGICDEELDDHFGTFGAIHEISIARKPDGRMRGFAFINFKNANSAAKAISGMNGKELSCGKFTRTIAVDYAVAKKKFDDSAYAIKDDENEAEKKTEKEASKDDDSEESDDDSDIEQENEKDAVVKNNTEKKHQDSEKIKTSERREFVNDGRTLFVRNLTFDTNQDQLREIMEEFGEVEYALICVDKMTEHSKGSGFVKFKTVEGANACLEAASNLEENEDKFFFDGRLINVQLAVSREKLQEKSTEADRARDKRNLYLVREGLIYPDSLAAKDVSPEDLEKRMQLSAKKKALLENLHFFVAKNRLAVHNLPESFDDRQLLEMCAKAVGEPVDTKAINFYKVMRTKDKSTNEFKGSRGFGYVMFTTHRLALRCLRNLNNNPNVFSDHRRPIVEFSVENLNAIKKNKQDIMKESSESGLAEEQVDFSWAGMQSKPFCDKERVITPLVSRKLKDKSKQISGKKHERKMARKEERQANDRTKFIKLKNRNKRENKLMSKRKQFTDGTQKLEERFLKRPRPSSDSKETNQGFRPKKAKSKWFQ